MSNAIAAPAAPVAAPTAAPSTPTATTPPPANAAPGANADVKTPVKADGKAETAPEMMVTLTVDGQDFEMPLSDLKKLGQKGMASRKDLAGS